MGKKRKRTIEKFLNDELSESEIRELKTWLEKPENKEFLKNEIQLYHLINNSILSFDSLKAYNKTKDTLDHKKRVSSISFNALLKYAMAAVIVFLVSITIFFNKDKLFKTGVEVVDTNTSEIRTDRATLTLHDGSEVLLEKGEKFVSNTVLSNGEELIYNDSAHIKDEIVFNCLTVPRGGKYFIKLSDGTQVWLNSESKLKYPVSFKNGESREVELVYGEAYFDVSPSTKHNGTRFRVLSGLQNIEVLGTEFNVKAYGGENEIYTTLVEGKVSVSIINYTTQFLKPGELSVFNKETKEVVVSKVDVFSETIWRRGFFSFKNKTLKDIMKSLSRWYNVDVVFEDTELENVQFTGVIRRNQNIEEILTLIKDTKSISAYEIKNKTILLKK